MQESPADSLATLIGVSFLISSWPYIALGTQSLLLSHMPFALSTSGCVCSSVCETILARHGVSYFRLVWSSYLVDGSHLLYSGPILFSRALVLSPFHPCLSCP